MPAEFSHNFPVKQSTSMPHLGLCMSLGLKNTVILMSVFCCCFFAGQTLSPQLMFHNAASNIICQVLFGTRYEYDDPFIKAIVRCFTENAKIANGPWAMVSQSMFLTTLLPSPEN